MTRILFFLTLLLLVEYSCTSKVDEQINNVKEEVDEVDSVKVENVFSDSLREIYRAIGLVSISEVDSNILIDLRYASENNFMHHVLYDTISEAFLQQEVAVRLSKCQKYLDSIRPGYKLKVFDAVRPNQVQREMWNAMDSVPTIRRGKYVSNPVLGSVHNFGSAVDLTICDAEGNELDMGAGYDDFRDIAFPSKEIEFLASGELTKEQVANRKLLRTVMRSQKFNVIPSEWWHFNAFSRITAEAKFEMLLSESGTHRKSDNAIKRAMKSDSLSKQE